MSLTVGDIRRAIEGVADDVEVVVRASKEGNPDAEEPVDREDVDICTDLQSVQLQYAHDGDDTPYLALDAYDDEVPLEDETEATSPVVQTRCLRLVKS